MKQCILPYFNKEQFSGDIKLNKTSFENVEELWESVREMLEGDLPFRIRTDSNDSGYEDSINELIQTLYSKIEKLDLKFDFDSSTKRSLNRYVKSLVMPRQLTKVEQVISANIAGSDIITEDQRRNIRFNRLISSIYGKSSSSLNATRQGEFDDNIILRTIIDTQKSTIISNEDDLNKGLISFQSEQYNILKDYLVSQGYNLEDYKIPQNLYHTSTSTRLPVLTNGYYNIFTLMYNIIQKAKREGTFEQSLEEGWSKYIFNSKEATLYRAVNAYVNLAYFDQVLAQSLGEYIQINRDVDSPISLVKDESNDPHIINKYTFAKGNKFATKTWGVEDHDALKEMSKFSQILIKSIPVYEYNIDRSAELESFGKMEVKDFVNTISKLLDLGPIFSNEGTDKIIKDAIYTFQYHPRDSIIKIFRGIFEGHNKALQDKLFKAGFDQNYLNYLYSIYRICFKGSNSWDSIEQKFWRNNGIPQTYPIIDTVFGIMNSNVANNFLQTVYNYDTGKYETAIKKKYNTRRTKFDMLTNVNQLTINREDKKSILETYKISHSGRYYTISLPSQGSYINFSFVTTNNTGILDKNITSGNLQISNLPSLSELNLNNIEYRRHLISGVGLSDNEYKLMSILKFVDTMLATNFSSSQEGLRKLGLMQKLHSYNFKEIFSSAARALVVTDIYNQMETTKKQDGTNYTKLELLQFLSDNDVYYDAIQSFPDKLKKQYFVTEFDGMQLSTLYSLQSWLDDLAQVDAILSGETSKSVISNLDGDKVPNFSPEYYGARIEQQLHQSLLAGNSTSNLLFVKFPDAVKYKVINTDVLTMDGVRKQIKSMTAAELLYDSIVNKFMTPLIEEKAVYSQPTTYSDKTKFILYGIDLEKLGLTDLTGKSFNQNIENLISSTIGETYKSVWNNVLEDYKKIFPEYVNNNIVNTDLVQQWFNTHSQSDLQKRINEYNNKNKTNLVFYNDTHFREISIDGKGALSINELLFEYSHGLYSDKLHSRLEKEKINFANDLLSNLLMFKVELDPDNPSQLLYTSDNSINKCLIKLAGKNANKWIRGSNIIIAKATNSQGKTRDVLYGKIRPDETIELNPVLNAYFMLDNLVGNNLRMSLTGSEINHKVKSLGKTNLDKVIVKELDSPLTVLKPLVKQLNPSYSGKQLTFYDIQRALDNYSKLQEYKNIQSQIASTSISKEERDALTYRLSQVIPPISVDTQVDDNQVSILQSVYNEQIYKIENAAQNAQFKRNVIIPGTMRPYTPNCITGIGSKIKVAVIKDVKAPVFNFDGKSDSIDAHDGSAFESPFTSQLENNSLQDSEVGTVKKPIHHWYDDRFGTATLLKYAVDTITNQWMRQSEGNNLNGDSSAIRLRKLFKKMHNIRWSQTIKEGEREIDLINGCDYKAKSNDPNFRSIRFFQDILKEHELFYKKGIQDVQILDFGRENGVYYTIEQEVDPTGHIEGRDSTKVKVYHYFDEDSNHHPSTTLLNDSNLHSIDSLYELHTALGGIYSESKNSDGFLQYSEASNNAVTNFINMVAYAKDPNQSNKVTIDQQNYYQPLKQMLIDVVANNSAVKNGAGNINPSSSYYDDTKLTYIELGTSQYGIQMDADHTADEGTMTEFSQVISSLDAGGRLHDYVSQIYQTLGQVATQLSQVELDSVEAFRNNEGKSKLYDIVARTIINNFEGNKEDAGLAQSIISNIKEGLNLNSDHALDNIKLAFSDPNIYSKILPTFVSVINKKSIKRQYPGQGTVMVPGYDLSMIYELDGKTYQFEDLINLANQEGYTSEYTDIAQYNREIVWKLLSDKQKQMQEISIEEFIPTDNVLVQFNQEGIDPDTQLPVITQKVYHAKLNKINDYYLFKEDINAYLESKGIVGATNITYKKDITGPRNLAPAKISWKYSYINPATNLEEQHTMNIFDHWRIKGLFKYIDEIENQKGISSKEKKNLINEARKRFNPQQAFDDLYNGIYVDENGTQYAIGSLKNIPAELIMSNLYKSKFGLKDGDSLAYVRDQESKYFKYTAKLISSSSYDMAFTKQSGRHLYLTFKPLFRHKNDESFDSHYKEWEYTIPVAFKYPEGTKEEDKKIINRVYATTRDNLPIFEIGREIINENVLWDPEKGKFTDKDGNVLKDQKKYKRYGEDKVLEYIEFLSQYNVQEEIDGKLNKYTVYNINRQAISAVFNKRQYSQEELTRTHNGDTFTITEQQKRDEEINDFISRKLLAKIYQSSDFNGVQLNSTVTPESHTVIKNCLYRFGNELKYDPELSKYLSVDLLDKVKNSTQYKDGLITYKKLNSIVNAYRMAVAKKQYASFLRSQSFTASRIPAQTLQSFMQMRCVGFTGTATNQCFVSHWQTWLQGSDYDIDKAYIMGLSFDGNGRYVGWSNLFDYSSEEAIKVSEKLPMPKGVVYTTSEDGINIDSYVNRIEQASYIPEERVSLYASLLNYLYKNHITKVSYTNPYGKVVLEQLGLHEFTNIPANLKEDAYKNFISSHIQYVVQNVRNMIGAYSPIEMEDFREASNNSPKGEQSSKMTMLNPTTKLLMQIQNITGKNVIGIAANGEKGSFMWHYYINDVLRQINPLFNADKFQMELNAQIDRINQESPVKYGYVNIQSYLMNQEVRETVNQNYKDIINKIPLFKTLDLLSDELNFAKFNFNSTRIYGRAVGDPQPKLINTLPDINFEGMDQQLLSIIQPVKFTGDITVDLMISQVLSAATDNAKELILSKVNAGNKLAKMYLFLITMGFDINDIVKFMTSPAISFIDAITDSNIFSGREISLKNAIKIAKGDYSSLITGRAKEYLLDKDRQLVKMLSEGKIDEFKNPYSTSDYQYSAVEDLITEIGQIKSLQNYDTTNQDIINDILEFQNVMEGADEFSSFAQTLGMNQGIPTSKIDLQRRVSNLENIYQKRFTETGIPMESSLDVKRFFTDPEYARWAKRSYNSVKKCVNTFAAIDYIPQFKAIFTLFSAVLDIDHNIAIKTKIYDYVYNYLRAENPYITEKYQNNLLGSIDTIFISMFLGNLDIQVPYPKNTTILQENRQSTKAVEGGLLRLDSLGDIATFKRLFENQIIPGLQRGIVYDITNGRVQERQIPELITNPFIRSLIRGFNKDIPLYKCDLNMLTIDRSNDSKIKFQTYLKGLKALKSIYINNNSLSDLFVLYNLIVNRNQYGADRLTTLFDTFLQNNESLSMIKNYLSFIGDLDYSGEIEGDGNSIKIKFDNKETDFLVQDLTRLAAPIVRTPIGQNDPTIIVNTENGPQLYIREGYNKYTPSEGLIPVIKNELPEQRLERIYNDKAYFVLGGSYKSLADRLIQDIQEINDSTLSALISLQKRGILIIQKECK